MQYDTPRVEETCGAPMSALQEKSSKGKYGALTVDVHDRVRPLPILPRGNSSQRVRRRPNLFVDFPASPMFHGASPRYTPRAETPNASRNTKHLHVHTPSSCVSDSVRSCPYGSESNSSPAVGKDNRGRHLSLAILTPQSCTSSCRFVATPRSPDPRREELKLVASDVHCVLFDFDGTLTATPGEKVARQSQKTAELCERASMLEPALQMLKDRNILLGIISKSTEFTIRNCLQAAGLSEFFTGPIVGKAVGLEGKVGFIEDLVVSGRLGHLGSDDIDASLRRILLVDDDIQELDRARARGIQTFPAPIDGGMQDEDFVDVFGRLGLLNSNPWEQSLTAGQSLIPTFAGA